MLRRIFVAVLACGVLCGCDDQGVHAYRAPKPPPKPAAAAPEAASRVAWKVPQGWQPAASNEQMRLATFKAGDGLPEVTVTAFPGDVGGLLANINRWRGQVGLGPTTEADIAKESETGEAGGIRFTTVDIAGSNGQRLLGAVIVPGDGKTWFVKTVGTPEAVGKIKPAFAEFARSFRLETSPAPTASGTTPTTPKTGDEDGIGARLAAWKLPENWKPDAGASSMVAAAFDASNPDGAAKITATMLINDGGGALANINRWREQLGLPPVERLEQQPVTDLGPGNMLVDLLSPDDARRMSAAIVGGKTGTWFFKITGSPKAVGAEMVNFERLVRGVGLGEQAR